MRDLPGVNVVHKSNNEYNPQVVAAVKDAKHVKNTRDYIDLLNGAKSKEDISESIIWEMPTQFGEEER